MFVGTCIMNFAYAFCQRRKFQELDDSASMLDFVALCTGLPELPGYQLVENQLKQFMQQATGENVVGVSVCWGFKDIEDDVQDALDRDVQALEGNPEVPDQ